MKLNTDTVRKLACDVFKITQDELMSKSRTSRIAFARHALSHALTLYCELTQEEAAKIIGRTRSNVQKATITSIQLALGNLEYNNKLAELMRLLDENKLD